MTGNGVRHFLDLIDIAKPTLAGIINSSREMKSDRGRGVGKAPLAGKTLAMIFDKPSTRTRVSFDVAMRQLGGEFDHAHRAGNAARARRDAGRHRACALALSSMPS